MPSRTPPEWSIEQTPAGRWAIKRYGLLLDTCPTKVSAEIELESIKEEGTISRRHPIRGWENVPVINPPPKWITCDDKLRLRQDACFEPAGKGCPWYMHCRKLAQERDMEEGWQKHMDDAANYTPKRQKALRKKSTMLDRAIRMVRG